MKYTPEQRHQLEKEFTVKLAAFIGCEIGLEMVHSSSETDPRVGRALELSRKLLDTVEQTIS